MARVDNRGAAEKPYVIRQYGRAAERAPASARWSVLDATKDRICAEP
jgi:hypothetical protein